MTLLGDIVSAYRGFGPSMRKQLAPEAREEKMLLYVMLATLIFFAARIPSLLDVAKNTSDAELTMTNIIGANFATSIFFGPLMLYGIAALSHLIAKPFGGKATFQEARLAFFWTLLVISPIVLLSVVLRAFIPAPEFVAIGNMAVLVVFIYSCNFSPNSNKI